MPLACLCGGAGLPAALAASERNAGSRSSAARAIKASLCVSSSSTVFTICWRTPGTRKYVTAKTRAQNTALIEQKEREKEKLSKKRRRERRKKNVTFAKASPCPKVSPQHTPECCTVVNDSAEQLQGPDGCNVVCHAHQCTCKTYQIHHAE